MPVTRGVIKTSVQPDLSLASAGRAGAEHITLGSSIGIANPINASAGDRLLLFLTQTGPGGFTINYGSAFASSAQPSASGSTIMEYYFDGSKWWLLYSH